MPDECQDTSADCNRNGSWDTCDIFYGNSTDTNGNGIPDECEVRVFYVDDDAPGDPGPGDPSVSDPLEDGSAEHPFDAIQEAVDVTVYGNTVVVRKGLYRGPGNRQIVIQGRTITVQGEDGPEGVIVTGEQDGPIFQFQNGGGAEALLVGLTLSDTTSPRGGAIVISYAKPVIRECVIRNNVADQGAGIYCPAGDAVIEDCEITGNHVSDIFTGYGNGGGIYIGDQAGATIRRCRLRDNASGGVDDFGGGIFIGRNTRPVQILGCTLSGNRADHGGGIGIAYADRASEIEIVDCLFAGNLGHGSGGALIVYRDSGVTMRNLTMVNNRATSRGGALYLIRDAQLVHCILAGNQAHRGSNAWLEYDGADLDVSYSDVVGGDATIEGGGHVHWGPGTIDADPRFAFPPAGNFHLRLDSPCRDSGDPSFVPLPGETDFEGDARILGGIVDMGADEVGAGIPSRPTRTRRLRW